MRGLVNTDCPAGALIIARTRGYRTKQDASLVMNPLDKDCAAGARAISEKAEGGFAGWHSLFSGMPVFSGNDSTKNRLAVRRRTAIAR